MDKDRRKNDSQIEGLASQLDEVICILRGTGRETGMVGDLETIKSTVTALKTAVGRHEKTLYGENNSTIGLTEQVRQNSRARTNLGRSMWFLGTVVAGDLVVRLLGLI